MREKIEKMNEKETILVNDSENPLSLVGAGQTKIVLFLSYLLHIMYI